MPPILTIILLIVVAAILFGVYKLRPAWYAGRGNAEYMKGNLEQALQLLEKAANMGNAKPAHKISYAFLLMRAGKAAKAEQLLESALWKMKPGIDKMRGKLNLATAKWLLGQRDESISLLEELHRDYRNTAVYGNLGYFMLLHGRLEEALTFNQEAIEYNDSDVTIMDNMAQTYYMLGRYEEAAEWYEKTAAKQPKHAETYYFYALTLQKLGKKEEALEQARAAVGKPQSLVTPLTKEEIEALPAKLESEI